MDAENRSQCNLEGKLQEKPNKAVPEEVNWKINFGLSKLAAWEFMDQADGAKYEDNSREVKDVHPDGGTCIDYEKHWLIASFLEVHGVPFLFRQCVHVFVDPIFGVNQVESCNLEQGLNKNHGVGWKLQIWI